MDYYTYWVKYYVFEKQEYVESRGLVCASCFVDATDRVINYFDDPQFQHVEDILISCINDMYHGGGIFELNDEILEAIVNYTDNE